jgi:hypothetical protein
MTTFANVIIPGLPNLEAATFAPDNHLALGVGVAAQSGTTRQWHAARRATAEENAPRHHVSSRRTWYF